MKPALSEQAIFAEALQYTSPDDRAAYLRRICGEDSVLRQRVEALLRAAERAGDFLEQPPSALAGDGSGHAYLSDLFEKPGDRIGRDNKTKVYE